MTVANGAGLNIWMHVELWIHICDFLEVSPIPNSRKYEQVFGRMETLSGFSITGSVPIIQFWNLVEDPEYGTYFE
jgi:hypothetical protein